MSGLIHHGSPSRISSCTATGPLRYSVRVGGTTRRIWQRRAVVYSLFCLGPIDDAWTPQVIVGYDRRARFRASAASDGSADRCAARLCHRRYTRRCRRAARLERANRPGSSISPSHATRRTQRSASGLRALAGLSRSPRKVPRGASRRVPDGSGRRYRAARRLARACASAVGSRSRIVASRRRQASVAARSSCCHHQGRHLAETLRRLRPLAARPHLRAIRWARPGPTRSTRPRSSAVTSASRGQFTQIGACQRLLV